MLAPNGFLSFLENVSFNAGSLGPLSLLQAANNSAVAARKRYGKLFFNNALYFLVKVPEAVLYFIVDILFHIKFSIPYILIVQGK